MVFPADKCLLVDKCFPADKTVLALRDNTVVEQSTLVVNECHSALGSWVEWFNVYIRANTDLGVNEMTYCDWHKVNLLIVLRYVR
ncbi:hypothetical protein VA249_36740 [Vibrio alfacsensis]|nr:hypothetical protein VA249_36740 [Vibrio alfacsensis]